jgi:hypothetical protein
MTISFPPINYPNKPVPPFTAPPPRNPFPGFFPYMWENITGKPFITVSSKGLANGQSEYFNDGADFGPDSLQADGSLTQTCGIREAINYAVNNSPAEIHLSAGVFNISAPFVNYSNTSTARYGLINVMPKSITKNTPIKIVGVNGAVGSGGSNNQIDTINNTVLNILTPAISGTAVYQTVFYVPPSVQNNTEPYFEGIAIQQPTPCNIGGFFDSLTNLSTFYAKNLWVGPVNEDINFFSGVASTNTKATAFCFNANADNVGWADNLAALQMYSALVAAAHIYIGSLVVQSCIHGLDITDTIPYGFYIAGFDVQGTQYPIYQTNTGFIQSLGIGQWFEEDYTGNSGVNPDFETTDEIYATGGMLAVWIGLVNIHRDAGSSSGKPQTPTVTGTLANISISNLGGAYNGLSVDSYKQYLSPTISTNPPASATVYQNTNPYDIRLKIPITYNPSTTAAATLATGISSSSTVTTSIKTSLPSGLTAADGQILTYDMVVPAGWYFELVTTNATIGTVEVEAA